MRSLADLRTETERLLASDRLTTPTRDALRARLDRRFGAPKLFDAVQMHTLAAACARLIPDGETAAAIDLPAAFDDLLSEGDGDGWRYADLPVDARLHRLGLDALEASAQARFGAGFATLPPEQQDALLTSAAKGDIAMPDGLDGAKWFEEFLATLVELHYSHPLAQVAIGYDGMADARGHQAVGLQAVADEANRAG